MPKLRADDYDINWDELEETPVESSFEPYDGPQPPKGTILSGYHKKMWWTLTAKKPDGTGEDPMIVDLWIAEANEGDEEKYNGLPVFSYWPLIPSAKFRWAPAFEVMGITLRDIRSKAVIGTEDEEDRNGIPIKKIGSFVPGEGNDAAWCRIVTEEHEYDGKDSTKADTWLPWEDGEEVAAEDIPANENEDAEIDLDEEEETEPEPEPAPTRAARGRGAGASAASARTASKAPAGRAASATPARASGRPSATGRAARAGSATPSRPSARVRTAPAADVADEEPPF